MNRAITGKNIPHKKFIISNEDLALMMGKWIGKTRALKLIIIC